MPGIVPYNNITEAEGASQYRYWQCGLDGLVDSRKLVQSPNYDNPYRDPAQQDIGLCQAGRQYVWGFSFLFSLLVAILHLVFTALMYALWLASRGQRGSNSHPAAPGFFADAVNMVTQAQKRYGMRLDEWTATGLKREVLNGKFGMTYLEDSRLRRRKADQSQALGDAYGGDWGGDVVIDERGR